MAALSLPRAATAASLLEHLNDSELLGELDVRKIALQVEPQTFVSCSAMAVLCGWGLLKRQAGTRFTAVGDGDTLRYLSRMDLFGHLGVHFDETFTRHTEAGRFIPLQLVEAGDDALAASNAICDLVLHQFDNACEFLPAMEWAVYEIIDNIVIHSETPVPGVVCGQYFPQKHRLDIAICDMGRGIKASLGESLTFNSHGEAISKALERGVTRSRDVGQGNGLAGSLEIIRQNQGGMALRSGDVEFRVQKGQEKGFGMLPEAPGTSVTLRLDVRNSVDLADTFIGDNAWTYINVECERIAEEGGIRVLDECAYTGGREPAKALRRKVQALLSEMDEPLPIDFDGVERAPSSFLDELLGRLAESLGEQDFRQRVRVTNASDQPLDMANVVINQRLEAGHG